MEAAAVSAFAQVRELEVICVAHVTNSMATDGDDFEKGEADGAHDALEVGAAISERHAEITRHGEQPGRPEDQDARRG